MCLWFPRLLFSLYKLSTITPHPSVLSWTDLCKILTMSFTFFMCFFLNPECKLLFVSGSLNYIQIITNLSFLKSFILLHFPCGHICSFLILLYLCLKCFFTCFCSFCSLSPTFIFFLVREASEHVFFANQFFLHCFHLFYFFFL